MSVTEINTNSELSAARELRAMMQGRVVLRGDGDYARTRQIWNRAVESQPAFLAVCETSADVQAAVRMARRYNLPLSVWGAAGTTGRAVPCAAMESSLTSAE
jgi:FAD/FMN-containing dehydrogenase